VRSAAAALAGLIASPAFRDLQALLARRDHVASFEAQFRTLAIQRTDAEKRAPRKRSTGSRATAHGSTAT
jgi:hypothetical protein